MKTSVLLLSAVIALFSFTALAAEAPLSARAAANQPRVVSAAETSLVALAYVAAPAPISARAQANQIKLLKGTGTGASSTLTCVAKMSGGPQAIKACTEHPETMPGCQPMSLAITK